MQERYRVEVLRVVLFHFPASVGILRCLGPDSTDPAPGSAAALVCAWSLGDADPPLSRLCSPTRPLPVGPCVRSQTPWDLPAPGLPSRGQAWRGSPWPRGRSELLLAGPVIRAEGPRSALPGGPSPGGRLGLGCGPPRACAPQPRGGHLCSRGGLTQQHQAFCPAPRSGGAWPSALRWVAPH